jgi:hypothetical protein
VRFVIAIKRYLGGLPIFILMANQNAEVTALDSKWTKIAPPTYDEVRLAKIVSNGGQSWTRDSGFKLQYPLRSMHVIADRNN